MAGPVVISGERTLFLSETFEDRRDGGLAGEPISKLFRRKDESILSLFRNDL